jgi:hypothetical protein
VNVSDSDAGQGADAGEALSAALADSDAGHSTEGQNSPGGSASDSDTGHGADGGESVAASLADADAGHGTDAGESVAVAGTATARAVLSAPYQPEPVTWAASPVLLTGPQAFNDSDVGHGADAGEAVHASLSDSDAGHGTDAGESGTGNVQKSDSDAGRGQDSGFAFISGSDAGHGADAEAPFTFAGSDAGQGAEAEWSRWPHDAEAGTGAEAQHWSGPLKDTAEAGHGADAGEAMAVADAGAFPAGDSCLSSDTPNPVVDIFTYVPTWDIGQGGGLLRIVWTNPETGQRHVVIQSSRPDGNMLRAARELAAAREVAFPADSDACRAADEEDGGILAVTGPAAAPALEVTAEVTW